MSPFARTVLLLALAAALLAAVAGCGAGRRAASPPASPRADGVVARVNGREVRQSGVDLARAEARLVGQKDTAAAGLKTAIDGALVAAEAGRLHLKADQAEVERRLNAVRDKMGGEQALAAALAKTRMTRAQLRTSLEQGLLREDLQNARFPQIKASAAAVRSFYERNRERLFTTPAAVELGAFVVRNEGIAGNAVKRLAGGRPFSEVAHQFSVDPELRDSEGMMGWVVPASLPAPLRTAVARLGKGQVSPPTAGPGGVWVLKVLGRRARTVAPFSAVRAQIQQGLDGQMRSAALARWLAKARAAARIERL
jgi:parvulin-like peptidyl-prolyl isomerase